MINALTVAPASGEKINGGSASGTLLISTEGQGLTFVYVDGTVGWKTVHENEFTSGGSTEIVATGDPVAPPPPPPADVIVLKTELVPLLTAGAHCGVPLPPPPTVIG